MYCHMLSYKELWKNYIYISITVVKYQLFLGGRGGIGGSAQGGNSPRPKYNITTRN